MKNSEPKDLRISPRPSEMLSIEIPLDTLESLKRVAIGRTISVQALVKFYIGQGLRQDLSLLFAEGVLDNPATVLSHYAPPENQAVAVIRESTDEVTSE